ncbi:MAG: hypothetical protein ABJF69_16630, partial [Anderseniella sp.]
MRNQLYFARFVLSVFAILTCSLFVSQPGFAQQPYTPPLDAYVDTSSLPQDLLSPADDGGPPAAERVRVENFAYSEISVTEPGVAEPRDIGAQIVTKLILNRPLKLNVAGLDAGFGIEVGTGELEARVTALGEELSSLPGGAVGSIDLATLSDVRFRAEITAVSLPIDLVLNREFFKAMKKDPQGNYIADDTDSDGDGRPDAARLRITLVSDLKLVVQYTWDGETEIFFEGAPGSGNFPSFALANPAVMLGDSGVVLEISEMALDFSTSSSPPSVAEGPAWRGVVLESVTVAFTNGLTSKGTEDDLTSAEPGLSLSLQNFQIGTGGISGTITGAGLGVEVGLSSLVMELDTVQLAFQQNALTGSRIAGVVKEFPFFEKDIMLELALDMSGNFTIGVAANDPNRPAGGGLVAWEIQDVLTLEVQSIAFEYREDVFLTRLNGAVLLDFLATDPDVKSEPDSDARVPVNNLTIGSDGKVSLEGGWVTLPEKRYLDFNAFRVELAQIGFGTGDGAQAQKWMGFSGGVELVKGLSANAKFKKMQFLWPKRNGQAGVDTRLQGISVGFSKPGVVSFEGAVDWFEDAGKKGFAGSIEANLEFIKTSVDGRLVIGQTLADTSAPATQVGTCTTPNSNDPFKFFFLDLEANLPKGIPVFSNVSIYGFLGLFAVNMEPHMCAFQTPLDWFRKHLEATNVVAGEPPPWIPRDEAVAVGLGVILGTTHDDGYVINTKIALTVAVPGPVVMLTGAGNIVKSRGELTGDADPNFLAIAVYDGRQSVFLINLGVFYRIPDDGSVFDISAQTEAFFNLADPNDWHLWLGKKDPESERIRATVLKFLSANAYYMLDPNQLGFGSKAGFDSRPKWKFGPLRVELAAWVGFDIAIAWRPVHAWGAADLGGHAKLKAFGFGIGLSAHAGLEVETPTPFVIDGRFSVKLNLPWPLPDPKASVHLRWEKERPKPPLDQLVTKMSLEASKTTASVDAKVNRSVTVSAGHTVSQSTLCSAWESLPVVPELDEDLNENGSLDPGEDFDGDGTLGVSTPKPQCTTRPMIPVTYRPVVAFGRNTNERLTGTDQPTLAGNAGNYRDTVGAGEHFEYNLKSLRLWATKKTTASNV